jgi:hypothetical protein
VIVAGPFQRGETISFLAGVVLGSVGDVSVLPTANLKLSKPGKSGVPGADVPVAAGFTVTASPALGDVPAGWLITLTAAQTAALPVGTYVTDVRCLAGGGVYISDPVAFRLTDPVTAS